MNFIRSIKSNSALLIFVVLLQNACVSNEIESIDIEAKILEDQRYYPIAVGNSWEYQVDSILYRQGKFLDSTNAFILEKITQKFTDSTGSLYFVERYWRKKKSDTWQSITSATVRIVENRLIKNEGNFNIIKLVFPLQANEIWNGLTFLNTQQIFDVEGERIQIYDGWESFQLKGLHQKEIIGAKSYDAITTILQSDEEDILAKRYSLEKYARGIGLVYKEMIIYDCNNTINQCTSNTLPWSKRATKGFYTRHTLLKFN